MSSDSHRTHDGQVFPRNINSGVCMPDAAGRDVPHALAAWMQPFRAAFTVPTWRHVLVLVMGAILVPGRRTVASALRVMGLEQVAQFSTITACGLGLRDSGAGNTIGF